MDRGENSYDHLDAGGVAVDKEETKREVIDPNDRVGPGNPVKEAQTEPVPRKKFGVRLQFDLIAEQNYLNESLPDALARLQTVFKYMKGVDILSISTTGQPMQEG